MGEPIRILYVDDYPLDRELVREALDAEGGRFDLTEADSRAAFEQQLEAATYDLVLSDLDICGYDGLQVIDAVRLRQPAAPVVVLTGTGSEELAVEAMKRGAADYLVKSPERIWRLPVTIRSVVGRERLVAERQRALDELRRSEQRYRLLFENLNDAAFLADARTGRILDVNRAGQELLGKSYDEIVGMHQADLHPPQKNAEYRGKFQDHVERGRGADYDGEVIRKDGTVVPVWINASAINLGGRPCILGLFRDMTQQKRTEQALRESQSKLDAMLQSIGDHMSMMDRELNILWTNHAAQSRFGSNLAGRKCYRVYHGRDEPCPDCVVLKSFRDRGIHEHDTQVVDQEGRHRHFDCTANVALRDEAGQPTAVMEISRDVTEQKAAEAALRESEARFRSLVERLPAIMYVAQLDETSTTLYASPQVETILGFSQEDYAAQPQIWLQRLHPEDRDRVLEAVAETHKTGEPLVCEYRMVARDGRVVWFHDEATVVRDEGGEPLYLQGFMVDITERKALEDRLARAEKLEAMGQLAAGIAHEINTPAQYVADNTRFLRQSFADLQRVLAKLRDVCSAAAQGPVSPELLRGAQKACEASDLDFLLAEIPAAIQESLEGLERVAEIVRAMKEFSHPGTEEKTPVHINEAVASTITVARNEWKYVAEVVTDLDPDLPPVPCAPADLNQVILNLVVNAAHAIEEKAGSNPGQKGTITVSTGLCDDHVEIRVRDTGAGIPDPVAPRIFDPFFTTKEVGKGTGQGLAIAHSVIVEKHGGSIAFETEPGEGTEFIVTLPVEAAEAAPAEVGPSP
ncbi:MAG: PAS domain S-box protein [Candidatus Brocadiia bacterium]